MKALRAREKLVSTQGNMVALEESITIHGIGIHTDNTQFYYYPRNNQDLSRVKNLLLEIMRDDMDNLTRDLTLAEQEDIDNEKNMEAAQKQLKVQAEKEEFDTIVRQELMRLKAQREAQKLLDNEDKKPN
jgi:hypothetical protein